MLYGLYRNHFNIPTQHHEKFANKSTQKEIISLGDKVDEKISL